MSLILRLCALVAAFAPARLWPAIEEYVPVTSSAGASAILTILASAAIGIHGFILYGTDLASLNNKVFLDMAVRPEAEGVLDSSAMAGMNSLMLFTFLFMTPTGWASMYLGLSGLLRALSAGVSDGMGDPALTAIDAVGVNLTRRGRTRVARYKRESLEGPAVPDQVASGASLGVADAELVIVASRPKAGWDRGTVVIAGEKFYRVGEIVERTIRGRLRTLYPLTEHRDLEVVRRSVHYEMPARAREP